MGFFDDDDYGYEYESEEDIAEENGCFIDDDGNWIPMDDDMEDALYEAREYFAWINGLKKKYANGKPIPAPEAEWPAMIAEWKQTDEGMGPWFHLGYWTGLGQHEYTQRIRDALTRHGFTFDEEELYCGEYEIGLDSVFGTLLDDGDEGQEDEVLDSIKIIDGVPYRDDLPAPVYKKYVDELQEYSWIPEHHVSEYSVHINSIGELEVSQKWYPSAYGVDDDDEDEKVVIEQTGAENAQTSFKAVETDDLPF